MEYRALLMECRALLMEYGAFLVEYLAGSRRSSFVRTGLF